MISKNIVAYSPYQKFLGNEYGNEISKPQVLLQCHEKVLSRDNDFTNTMSDFFKRTSCISNIEPYIEYYA